jgi:hypothetical protein
VSGPTEVAPPVLKDSFNFDDHFDLDRRAQRQRNRPHRGAGMSASLAEQLLQQLAGPVGHFGLVGEPRIAAHKHPEPDDSLNPFQASPQRVGDNRQTISTLARQAGVIQ